MGLLTAILEKVLGKKPVGEQAKATGRAQANGQVSAAPPSSEPVPPSPAPSVEPPAAAPATQVAEGSPAQTIDVAAVLDGLSEKTSEELDWRVSIVDLMKLLSLDSSLSARKELAKELHYEGNMNDSGAMNIWLHKQIMRKLAENGGKLPDKLAG